MSFTLQETEIELPEAPAKSKNDIKPLKNFRQLNKVNLDLESPRWKEAMKNLGISREECEKK